MSLAAYKARFDSEVNFDLEVYYDRSLDEFLCSIDNDPSYTPELRNICEQEIVVPFLREKLANLTNGELCGAIWRLMFSDEVVRIIGSAKMWKDVIRKIGPILSTKCFMFKLYMVNAAVICDSLAKALLTWTDIIPDAYKTLYGVFGRKPLIAPADMLNRIGALDTDEMFNEVIELFKRHDHHMIFGFLSQKLISMIYGNEELLLDMTIIDIMHKIAFKMQLQIIREAFSVDTKNKSLPGAKSIIDGWIDMDLLGMLEIRRSFTKMNQSAAFFLKPKLLDRSPMARAVERRWTELTANREGEELPPTVGPNGHKRKPVNLYVLSEGESCI